MGEFGFITADGTYHVTMFATDENGNYHILSKKSLRKIEEKLIKMITSPHVQEKLQHMVHSPVKSAAINPFKVISTTENYYNPQFPQSASNGGGGGADVGVAPTPFTIIHPQQKDNSYTHHETPSQADLHHQQQINPDPYQPIEQVRPSILEQPDYVVKPTPFTIHQHNENNNNNEQSYNNFQGVVSQTPSYNNHQANENTYEDVKHNSRKQEKKGRQLNLFGQVNTADANQSPPQSGPIQSQLAYPGQSSPIPPHSQQSQYPHSQQTPNYQQSQSPVYSELPAYQMQQPFADTHQQNTPIQSQQSLPQLSSPPSTGLLYKFNYTLPYHGHSEQGDAAGRKDGEYHVVNENGWKRVVTYTADENGFRPNSKYSYDGSALPRDETLNHVEFKWFNVNGGSK